IQLFLKKTSQSLTDESALFLNKQSYIDIHGSTENTNDKVT
ncbi:MAG: hypothetical protein RL628_910, partial [Actinomycetota bacterium]